jgi:ferric-dicitrate binding protein FerR (iron transport regulator)
VLVQASEPWQPGQSVPRHSRLKAGESGLQIELPGGSGLALAPGSSVILGLRNAFDLVEGRVLVLASETITVRTGQAIAQGGPSVFEVEAAGAESALTVWEGQARLSDPAHTTNVAVSPWERCLAEAGRLNRAFRLSKREAGEFEARWGQARAIHAQRIPLLKAWKKKA